MTPPGVNVLGYLREAKGIGEAARLHAVALRAAGVPVRTGALDAGSANIVDPEHGSLGELRRSRQHPVDLVCVNPPELRRLLDSGSKLPGGGYRIGAWAWEVDPLPADWGEIVTELDEIWVPSTYVAEIVARAVDVPVTAIPHPVPEPEPASAERTSDAFTFLFAFDFHSMLRRKNPDGLIQAYTRAFGPGDGARLVLKSFNGEERWRDLEVLEQLAAGRADVELVDRFVGQAEKYALIAGCDCYVSLHRSEGFGLTLAEAMALGRPVIATGFGGNLDFMSEETGYLVRAAPARVGPGVEVYPPDGVWAEPDLDHAAETMRAVFQDRDEASRRGERARSHILQTLAPAAVGALARRRLEAAEVRRPGPVGRLLRR